MLEKHFDGPTSQLPRDACKEASKHATRQDEHSTHQRGRTEHRPKGAAKRTSLDTSTLVILDRCLQMLSDQRAKTQLARDPHTKPSQRDATRRAHRQQKKGGEPPAAPPRPNEQLLAAYSGKNYITKGESVFRTKSDSRSKDRLLLATKQMQALENVNT
jgi:hypothetical protein